MRATLLTAAALSVMATAALADGYSVTVTNNLADELLAPIVVTNTSNDGEIFEGTYVTKEAEHQVLTGDPAMVVERIGPDAMVGHGDEGPPGVLLGPGKSITFDIETDATSVRVFAMIAPTMVPDNYVSNVVDIHATPVAMANLDRFDIGHDEGTMKNQKTGEAVATVKIERKM